MVVGNVGRGFPGNNLVHIVGRSNLACKQIAWWLVLAWWSFEGSERHSGSFGSLAGSVGRSIPGDKRMPLWSLVVAWSVVGSAGHGFLDSNLAGSVGRSSLACKQTELLL